MTLVLLVSLHENQMCQRHLLRIDAQRYLQLMLVVQILDARLVGCNFLSQEPVKGHKCQLCLEIVLVLHYWCDHIDVINFSV